MPGGGTDAAAAGKEQHQELVNSEFRSINADFISV
jgi:hypothetical protein